MKNDDRIFSAARRDRGLSLVEVLIMASIGSMLLTAVGVAFNASFNSYKDAQQRGQLLNSGRGFMMNLTNDIKACDLATPMDINLGVAGAEGTQWKKGAVPGYPNSGEQVLGGSGTIGIRLTKIHPDTKDPTASVTNPVYIDYVFDSTTRMVMTAHWQAPSAEPALTGACRFVQSFQIYMLPFPNPNHLPHTSGDPMNGEDNPYILKRASIILDLQNKDATGARLIADGGQNFDLTLTDSAAPRKSFPGY